MPWPGDRTVAYTIPGLTAEAAAHICMVRCKAMCCREPFILRLAADEVPDFEAQAAALGVALRIELVPGGGWVRFSDHDGGRCPMLDPVTSACRIYSGRPQRCREFPERPTPGCAISGG